MCFLCLQRVRSLQRRSNSKRKRRSLRVLQRGEVIELFEDYLTNMYQSIYRVQIDRSSYLTEQVYQLNIFQTYQLLSVFSVVFISSSDVCKRNGQRYHI